uniref:Uncharacterized protein n=1 Tax=viral metagenome TaxID=1070528 RepID=A0A6C0CAD4_9ZZZZ
MNHETEVVSLEYKQKFIELSSNFMFIDNCIPLLNSRCSIKGVFSV